MRTIQPSVAPKFTASRDPASTVGKAVIKQYARLALPANLAKLGVSRNILLERQVKLHVKAAVEAGNRQAGFDALRKWAGLKLKGMQRNIVEYLIDSGGIAPISEIANQADKNEDIASDWFRHAKNRANIHLRPKKWIIEIVERGKRGKGPGIAELRCLGKRE